MQPRVDETIRAAHAMSVSTPPNAHARVAYEAARQHLHNAVLADHGLHRTAVRVAVEKDNLWHAIAAAANNGTDAEFLRAEVVLFMRLYPGYHVTGKRDETLQRALGCDGDMARYAERIKSLSDWPAELRGVALGVAARVLRMPIVVVAAQSLDATPGGTVWPIEQHTGRRDWDRKGVNAEHVVLLWYDNHFDAAVLWPSVERSHPRPGINQVSFLTKVWDRFHAGEDGGAAMVYELLPERPEMTRGQFFRETTFMEVSGVARG